MASRHLECQLRESRAKHKRKTLDPGAYPGKENVGIFRESHCWPVCTVQPLFHGARAYPYSAYLQSMHCEMLLRTCLPETEPGFRPCRR